ncbi:MAG: hypothetical protein OHK93_008491 [Ramalina farinacea]|uniref:Peptidase A1 domain-containing protein n=1 Tax=Ramalina farinacea TaxID=258253 RepID=A0AA43TV52_9LECA|nr:hypothetical protein [Ramalina farinacea]
MAQIPFVFLIFLSLFALSDQQAAPLQIRQSDAIYGPDGPWHAVRVELGSPPQKIDLLPGGTFQSQILTNYACQDQSSLPCGRAGLFQLEESSSLNNGNISYGYINPANGLMPPNSAWTSGALMFRTGNASSVTDTLAIGAGASTQNVTVNDFDIFMWSNIQVLYPDGSHYPLQIGQLALGNVSPNQSFNLGDGTSFNATLVPNYLKQQNVIGSSSYGLHYGSAPLGLDLSLWFGGYDRSRVLAPVSAQSYANDPSTRFFIDLLDVGIGVAEGRSPLVDTPWQGLLASGNDTLSDSRQSSIQVLINPSAPYLNLPNSTCNAIAQHLPVTYNAKYGLYFWNVDDPQYATIVNSPAYLNFSFPLNGGLNNFTINVPFQLLNLTLEAPLIAKPTQYFPCQPPQDPANQTYSLGRVFLQAAFVGVNWDEGTQWYLAQAPGPGVSSNPDYRPITSSSGFVPNMDSWADTWSKTWKVLPEATSMQPIAPTISPPSSSDGPSGGLVAGIAIGAICAVGAALAVGWLLYRRRQQATKAKELTYLPDPDKRGQSQQSPEQSLTYSSAGYAPHELIDERSAVGPSELSGSERYEMQHRSLHPHELAGSREGVAF